MNIIKKFVSILLMVSIILSLGAMPTFASDIATDYGLKSTNSRVQILTDSIAVYSHPYRADGTYPVSSANVISALTSSKGYTVTYTDENKNETTASRVTAGYVKLSKAGEEIFIPITKKGESVVKPLDNSAWYVSNAAGAQYSGTLGGIGGKGEDDLSSVFMATDALVSYSRIEHATNAIPFTIEMNIYADGDAIARANYRYSDDVNQLFYWDVDGTFYYNVNGTLTAGDVIKRAQWHKVAVCYDAPRGRYHIYLDGERLTDNGSPFFTDATRIMYGISKGSANGKVAFSDLESYYGYYYNEGEYALPTLSANADGVEIADGIIKVDPAKVESMDALASAISTDADSVSIFVDNTYTAEATELSDGNAVVLVDNDTKTYAYYTIKLLNVNIDSVEFSRTSDKVSAMANLSYEGSVPKTATLVMVLKDSDGRIVKVVSSLTSEVGASTQLSTPEAEHNGLKAEAFLLTDWNLREELSDIIYFEEE